MDRYIINGKPVNGNYIVRTKEGFLIGRISQLEQSKSQLYRIQTAMLLEVDHEDIINRIQSILDESKREQGK